MKRILFALVMLLAAGVNARANSPITLKPLTSPDGRLELTFKLWDFAGGGISYNLYYDDKPVVLGSRLGFELEWRDDLAHAFVLKDVEFSSFDEIWQPVWGE